MPDSIESPDHPATEHRFDVFLSHNSREKNAIERIAYKLREKGIEPWLDKWYLVPGTKWQGSLAEGLINSSSCAVFVGANNLGNWEWEELDVAQDRAAKDRNFKLIPVLLPGLPEPLDPSILPPFLSTRMWVDFRRGIDDEEALNLLVCAIRGVAPGPKDKSDFEKRSVNLSEDICPYRGLQTFDEEDASLFFGRDGEIQRLIEKLKALRFLAVIGPSGSGKSSLVRAGLIPTLKGGGLPGSDTWPIQVFTPSQRPLQAISLHSAQLIGKGNTLGIVREIENKLLLDGHALDFILRTSTISSELKGTAHPVKKVLVIDQFEEIFTLCQNEQERRAFISNLLYASTNPESLCVVIIAMRADFYPKCAAYAELSSLISSNQFIVSPMDVQNLRQVIEEPGARMGVRFEPGLVESILTDVVNQPGALPFLEYALLELWQSRQGDLLTLQAYEKSGGVKGAIANRADAIYLSFNQHQQSIIRNLMLRLTQPTDGVDDTRRPVLLSQLVTNTVQRNDIEEVIEEMAVARLLSLSAESQSGELLVNVSHEALIRGWPRLRQWIEEDRRGLQLLHQVSASATEWQQLGEDESLLFRGLRLQQIIEWRRNKNDSLNELEQRFIDASIEYSKKERSKAGRKKRLVIGGTSLGTLLTTILAAIFGRYYTSEQLSKNLYESDQIIPFLQSSMRGHTKSITSIVFSPDSRLVLTTSWDQTAQLWEARTGKVVSVLKGHNAWVSSGAFSSDGRFVITAGWNGIIKVWDANSGENLYELSSGTEGLKVASFSPDGKYILAATHSTGWVWDKNSKQMLFELRRNDNSGSYGYGGENPISIFSPDSKFVLSSLSARTAQLWDISSGKQLFDLDGHSNKIYTACFSHDGKLIATGSEDGTAIIWDAKKGQILSNLRGHTAGITVAVFSPDDKFLLTGSKDSTVRLWEVTSGRTLLDLRGHTGQILDACFSPNGRFIITAGWDNLLRGWDVSSGRLLVEFRGHTHAVDQVVFSPDGNYIASTDLNNNAFVWAASSLRSVTSLIGHAGSVTDAQFSNDGRLVVTSSVDHKAIVWDALDKRIVFEAVGHTQEVNCASFSPDNKLIVTASNDSTVRIWHIYDGRVTPLLGHTDAVNTAQFSPDGKFIITASNDNSAIVWDVQASTIKFVLRGHTDKVFSAAFSPDGLSAVTSSGDKTVKIWDLRTGSNIGELRGHEDAVLSALFSPDGKLIITASNDKTIRVWSIDDRRCIYVLQGHAGRVYRASMSPNGKYIASASADDTVRIWDIKQQRSIIELQGHIDIASAKNETSTYSVRFSPDGRFVVTAGSHNVARIWDISDCASP